MPKRIVLQTVALWRDGQRVVPPISKPFDFTKDELDTIIKLNPDAVGKIITAEEADSNLVTLTQAEIDANQQAAVDAAIAAFRKEQGIPDEPKKPDANTGNANKNATAGNKAVPDKKPATTGSDKNASSDDDI